ncbi:uncharacterized protein BJ212DRAFT_645905 [Suillus subaureus]|uniref:Secreted protein n=1 Tax=Suillus subaureus TaxID=48587 RepID=A0A9P7E1S0_9AGAM|nr:uncharacterized protein BJ212DRAFT_645905 [Suillus subaureus]KAG1808699.1 hypothetical protein BJ212DRAFT_645905 [Suillus subaureus]
MCMHRLSAPSRSSAYYLCALGSLLLACVVRFSPCLYSSFCNCAPPFPMCLVGSNNTDLVCSVSVSCHQELASLRLCAMTEAQHCGYTVTVLSLLFTSQDSTASRHPVSGMTPSMTQSIRTKYSHTVSMFQQQNCACA